MERHLTLEAMARLVDETPDSEEALHLGACARCRIQLDRLRDQTQALGGLPSVRPGASPWAAMEARLVAEGLLGEPEAEEVKGPTVPLGREEGHSGQRSVGAGSGPGAPGSVLGRAIPWSRLAAGLLLFLFGTGVGSMAGSSGLLGPGSQAESWVVAGPEAMETLLATPGGLSLMEAQEALTVTEEWHRLALERYRERMLEEVGESGEESGDPHLRYALMETLLQVGREALWAAPTDPFLNGLVLNVQVEQDAARLGMERGSPDRIWY